MILKCYQFRTLLAIAPALFVFELMLAFYLTVIGAGRDYVRAIRAVYRKRREILLDRKFLQSHRTTPDKLVLSADDLSLPRKQYGRTSYSGAAYLLSHGFRLYWLAVRTVL